MGHVAKCHVYDLNIPTELWLSETFAIALCYLQK